MGENNFLTRDDLVNHARTLIYPQSIKLPSDGVLQLTESLRVIPNKRLTARGIWQDKIVIAKLFFKGKKAAYYAGRDQAGIDALVQSGAMTPVLYYAGATAEKNVHVLIFEYIDEATAFSQAWESTKQSSAQLRLLLKITKTIAKQHDAGLEQQDMHAGNFMLKNGRIYSLDGDGIKKITKRKHGLRPKAGLKNLAMLIAQLAFVHTINTQQILFAYCNFRKIKPSRRLFSRFNKYIAQHTNRFRHETLQKTLRECTNFVAKTSLTLRTIWARGQSDTELPDLLPHLEQKVQQQPPAKMVAANPLHECIKLPSEQRSLMVKRYATRHLFEGFCAAIGVSTAKKAWLNSHHLNLLRVPAIKSIALCEKGFFPWFDKSYVVSEFIEGQPLGEFITTHEHDNEKVAAVFHEVALTIKKLSQFQITYGSMNASHFLVTEAGVLLTNFDKVKQHRSAKRFQKTARQDIYEFLKNWQDKPQIAAAAVSAFKQLNLTDLLLEQD